MCCALNLSAVGALWPELWEGQLPEEEAMRGLSMWVALGFRKVLTTAEAVLAEPWPVSSP